MIERLWNKASIQSKLMVAFFIPIIIILVMNIYMYENVNQMIARIDEVYDSNVRLNALAEQLTVQIRITGTASTIWGRVIPVQWRSCRRIS